jgi:Mn-dependent DtxR family transcriptional regulator
MYDRKCYELAEHFLSDEPEIDSEENRAELAQAIQTEIEDKIAELLTDHEAKSPAED